MSPRESALKTSFFCASMQARVRELRSIRDTIIYQYINDSRLTLVSSLRIIVSALSSNLFVISKAVSLHHRCHISLKLSLSDHLAKKVAQIVTFCCTKHRLYDKIVFVNQLLVYSILGTCFRDRIQLTQLKEK